MKVGREAPSGATDLFDKLGEVLLVTWSILGATKFFDRDICQQSESRNQNDQANDACKFHHEGSRVRDVPQDCVIYR